MATAYSSPRKPPHPSPSPAAPSKPIDLNSSTRSCDPETGTQITRRAFHCDIIVPNETPETVDLLHQLGAPPSDPASFPLGNESRLVPEEIDDPKRLPSLLDELVKTERSYVSRIRALKASYADPLRNFARKPEHMIIPLYEAKTIFANIDAVVDAAFAFLHDLELATVDSIAEICTKHISIGTFEPYRMYLGKQDESQRMFQDAMKKFASFSSFIESTKYTTTGLGNIGLRELLMEPVQRIPRYTLLWSTMVKCYPVHSRSRDLLNEAIGKVSKIAKCEPNEQTIRATVFYCLERNVEGFPANLFSSNRSYVDSIDVDDIESGRTHLTNTSASMSSVSTANSAVSVQNSCLHCSLFLFDDKIMIVKRQAATVSGRKVTGLDDMQRLVKAGGGVVMLDKAMGKKDKLSFRGVVDILDVTAADTGGGDFQLFFHRPPADQSERWSRQTRSYSTVIPPFSPLDRVAIRKDKARFLENLWLAQARARKAKALVSEELEVDPSNRVRCFWSVFEKPSSAPSKVVVRIEESPSSPEYPQSLLAFRLQPMPGGFVRFSFRAANEDEDREVMDVTEVLDRIIFTVHRYGVFRFKTNNLSAPNTPSSHRLRPSMLNLDALSRNLFGSSSVSSRETSTISSKKSQSSHSTEGRPASTPYSVGADKSEVDLNERLVLARKHSAMTAWSPNKSARPRSPVSGLPSTSGLTATMEASSSLPPRGQDMPHSPSHISLKTPLRVGTRSPSPSRPTEALSPRLRGPRPLQPTGESLPTEAHPSPRTPVNPRYPPLGAGHALRVVSGGGRRISPNRTAIPLRDGTSPRRVSNKRQHSDDLLQPRKRSDSRSPLQPRDVQGIADPPSIPGLPKHKNMSWASPDDVPYRTPIEDLHSTAVDENIASIRSQLAESRAVVKNLKAEIHRLRKQKDRGSLPRSPQRRNITRLVETDFDLSARADVDSIVFDEVTRSLLAMADKLETSLKQAVSGCDRAGLHLPGTCAQAHDETSAAEIVRLKEQVARAKGVQDMLRSQLAEVQLEVDVVYEAFNTELDGMFNDACLPEVEAFDAMRRDLQVTKARRNELELENKKLKRELEEGNLKREQWAKILREQGVLIAKNM